MANRKLADDLEGTIGEVVLLHDGSGFATMSTPLPKDHWLYERCDEPPAPLRMGKDNPMRAPIEAELREIGRYVARSISMSGQDNDFDPDALLQNLVVAVLGYRTHDGFSHLDD